MGITEETYNIDLTVTLYENKFPFRNQTTNVGILVKTSGPDGKHAQQAAKLRVLRRSLLTGHAHFSAEYLFWGREYPARDL